MAHAPSVSVRRSDPADPSRLVNLSRMMLDQPLRINREVRNKRSFQPFFALDLAARRCEAYFVGN
jgi:hypothetical protein